VSAFFSVCIDATNRHETIIECLESVYRQDFMDYEVIICDASTDFACFNAVAKWISSKADSRFKLFKTSRVNGESEIANWNRPIEKAGGHFIAMLEGDDFYHKGHLLSAFEALNKQSDVRLFFSRGTSAPNFSLLSEVKFQYIQHKNELLLSDLLKFNWCPVPSVTVFPRLIQNLPIKYNEEALWAAEYYLYYNLLTLPGTMVIEGAQTTVFRSPSTGTRNSFHLMDAENFLSLFGEKLEHNQLQEAQMKLKLWSIDYLYQNARLGRFDSGSVRILIKYSNKLEGVYVLFRVLIIHLGRIFP
jgi:hypothetical protein